MPLNPEDRAPARGEEEWADVRWWQGPAVYATGGIRCGCCTKRHASVADIRWCYDLTAARAEDDANALAEAEAERRAERYFEEGPESFAVARAAEEEADRMRTLHTDPIWSYAGALGYTGECSDDTRCDVYTRCKKHRAEDAANGVRNAHTKSYCD